MIEFKYWRPSCKTKCKNIINYLIVLTAILKFCNLFAALVVVNSVSLRLVSLDDIIFATKVSQICSSIDAQIFFDGVIVVCLAAKGVCAHISRRKKKLQGAGDTENKE